MNLVRKLKSFALGPVISSFLGLLVLPLLTWNFSTENVGRYTLLQTLVNFSMLVLSFAMHQAYVRHYNEFKDKSDLLATTLTPGLVITSLATILYFTVWEGVISKEVFNYNKDIDFSFFLICFVSFLNYIFLHVTRMKENVFLYNLTQLMPKIVIIFCLFLAAKDSDFDDLLSFFLFSILVVLLTYVFILRKELAGFRISQCISPKTLELVKFSVPLFFGSWAYWGLSAMDRLFLNWFSTLENLAIYGVAASFAGAASLLSKIFASTWHPIIYGMLDDKALKGKLQVVSRFMLAIVLTVWCLVGSFSWITQLFLPEEYKDVSTILLLCVSSPLIYMLSEVTVVGISIKKRTSLSMIVSITSLLLNLLLNYFLVNHLGAKGAAIATVLSFIVFFILRTEFSIRLGYIFDRTELYLSITLICFLTIIMSFIENSFKVSLFWFLLGVIIFLFKLLPAFKLARRSNVL